jgi:hypothetical protein
LLPFKEQHFLLGDTYRYVFGRESNAATKNDGFPDNSLLVLSGINYWGTTFWHLLAIAITG